MHHVLHYRALCLMPVWAYLYTNSGIRIIQCIMYLTRTTLLSDNSSHGFDVFCGCKPHPFLIRHPHLYRGADAAAAAAKIKTKLDNNALVAKHFFFPAPTILYYVDQTDAYFWKKCSCNAAIKDSMHHAPLLSFTLLVIKLFSAYNILLEEEERKKDWCRNRMHFDLFFFAFRFFKIPCQQLNAVHPCWRILSCPR